MFNKPLKKEKVFFFLCKTLNYAFNLLIGQTDKKTKQKTITLTILFN